LEHARLRSLTNNVESQAQARSASALGAMLPARVGPVTPERPKLRTEHCAGVIKREAWCCVAATQKVLRGPRGGPVAGPCGRTPEHDLITDQADLAVPRVHKRRPRQIDQIANKAERWPVGPF
jgi:hypothetical protein